MKKVVISVLVLLFLLSGVFTVFSEDLPLLAVPNISAVDVPASLAGTCRNMVETALIKTGKYAVLSYTDIEDILEAQAFSLSGCTDESCAIEIGKLLAADNIVVGEISLVGEAHVLSVRLVNVTSGRTLSAEVANIESLENLQDAVFTAAYALTGMKYVGGGAVTETGGLYVLAPEGMVLEVYLDGEPAGFTPALIEDIPFGVHILEAKGDGYQYSSEISVSSKDITEITADTALLKGNLFLAVNPPDASGFDVIIDEEPASTGLIQGLQTGDHDILITGGGWYFQGTVTIETGKTERVSADLLKAGSLTVIAPEGSKVSLSGDHDAPDAVLNREIILPSGDWDYTVTHPDYEPVAGMVTVRTAELTEVRPEYTHNEAWELKGMIAEAEADLAKAQRTRKTLSTFGWIFGSVGAAGLASGGVSEALIQYHLFNIERKTSLYEAATDPVIIRELGRSIDSSIIAIEPSLRLLRNYSLLTGGSGALVSGVFFLFRPKIGKIEEHLETLKARLQEVSQ